jgi:hypothetical protein
MLLSLSHSHTVPVWTVLLLLRVLRAGAGGAGAFLIKYRWKLDSKVIQGRGKSFGCSQESLHFARENLLVVSGQHVHDLGQGFSWGGRVIIVSTASLAKINVVFFGRSRCKSFCVPCKV